MTPDEQQELRASAEFTTEAAPLAAFTLALVFSFGLFDVLWIGLAVSSAYKIVRDVPQQKSQAQPVTIAEPAHFFPGLPPPTPQAHAAAAQPGATTSVPLLPGLPPQGGGTGDARRVG
jgi:hypothetical protein